MECRFNMIDRLAKLTHFILMKLLLEIQKDMFVKFRKVEINCMMWVIIMRIIILRIIFHFFGELLTAVW